MTPETLRFSTSELAMATGATVRQINLWCEAGFLSPQSPGRARIFDAGDAIVARFIIRMRSAHVTPEKLKELMREPGRARIISAARRSYMGAYVDRDDAPGPGPRIRIFPSRESFLDWMKAFPGPAIALDFWEFGPRGKPDPQPIEKDPAFEDGPRFGLVHLVQFEQGALMDVKPEVLD